MWTGFTKQGGIDEGSYLVGEWSELVARAGGVNYQLGNCPEGVLEVSREYYMHEDTSLPKKIDAICPIRTGMKFTGVLEEIHRRNVSLLVGQTLANTDSYVYIGAMGTAYFYTLRGRRNRCSDNVAIEFVIWKCMTTSLFSLGGGPEAQGSPFEATGIDDTDGDYGGDATNPLGYIWSPAPGT
jgi:hypothetical protein